MNTSSSSHAIISTTDRRDSFNNESVQHIDIDAHTPLLSSTRSTSYCSRRIIIRILIGSSIIVLLIALALIGFFIIFPALTPYHPHDPIDNRTCPDAPSYLHVVPLNATSLVLTWSRPAMHGSDILGYDVQMKCSNSSSNNFSYVASPQDSALTVTGLIGFSIYCFRVQAKNSIGYGNFSTVSCNRTYHPNTPTPPVNLHPLHANSDSITIGWDSGDGEGSRLAKYVIACGNHSLNASVTPPLRIVVSGLIPNTTYLCRMKSFNFDGLVGNWSEPLYVHTDTPGATIPHSLVSLPSVESVNNYRMRITWMATPDGGSQILSYNIRRNSTIINVGFHTQFLSEPLDPFTVYCFSVSAINSLGQAPFSVSVCAKSQRLQAPAAPGSPVLIRSTPSSLTLSWSVSVSQHIDSYIVERDNWWTYSPHQRIWEGNTTEFTTTGLLPSVFYSFCIRARNSAGISDCSPIRNYTTDHNGSCGNPSDIAVFRKTKNSMKNVIQKCLIGCALSGEKCAVSCIVNKLHMTHQCAQCWGDEGECTIHYCLSSCIFKNSIKCASCSRKYCFPDCVSCSGVPMWAYPP